MDFHGFHIYWISIYLDLTEFLWISWIKGKKKGLRNFSVVFFMDCILTGFMVGFPEIGFSWIYLD